jgi:hypothetical protein
MPVLRTSVASRRLNSNWALISAAAPAPLEGVEGGLVLLRQGTDPLEPAAEGQAHRLAAVQVLVQGGPQRRRQELARGGLAELVARGGFRRLAGGG